MISSRTKILFTLIFMLGTLSLPRFSHAISEIGLQDTDVSVDTIPETPEPYQDVTVTLTSYATDLNKASIIWTSGSNVVLSGIGKTSYSFKAQGPNTSTVISVSIAPAESPSDKITKAITINPSEIDVLWESVDGYTPPFYRGKSFASPEGTIKVVAIPNTNSIQSGKGSIVYNWSRNDSSVSGASGYNKDSYIFANSELNKNENITVNASSVNGGYDASKTIQIPIVQPEIDFYERSPTEGVLFDQALTDNTFMSADEMTLVAVPYFLAIKNHEDDFTYGWQVNGEDIATPTNKMELTISPTSRGGYATISLMLENLSTLFQKATGTLRLNL